MGWSVGLLLPTVRCGTAVVSWYPVLRDKDVANYEIQMGRDKRWWNRKRPAGLLKLY